MPAVRRALWLVPLAVGGVLLAVGVQRLGLPYENGRFFDPETGAVAHVQTAETLLIAGAVLCVVGLALLARSVASRRRSG